MRPLKKTTRRTALKSAVYASVLSSGLTSMVGDAQAQNLSITESTSFEEESVGAQSPASPWYLWNGGGTHEVSDDRASQGRQSFYTADAPLGDPSAIAVDIDVTPIEKIRYDVYAVSNDPSSGNVKISRESAGYGNDPENLQSVHHQIREDGNPGTGENEWHRDIEVDVSGLTGQHAITFWVDGNNAVYWDNIRFLTQGSEPDREPTDDLTVSTVEPGWKQLGGGWKPAGTQIDTDTAFDVRVIVDGVESTGNTSVAYMVAVKGPDVGFVEVQGAKVDEPAAGGELEIKHGNQATRAFRPELGPASWPEGQYRIYAAVYDLTRNAYGLGVSAPFEIS